MVSGVALPQQALTSLVPGSRKRNAGYQTRPKCRQIEPRQTGVFSISASHTNPHHHKTVAVGEAAAVEDIHEGVVVLAPRPSKGVASWAVDPLERLVIHLGHDNAKPLHWLSGNFAPVRDETPPAAGLPVLGHLPVYTCPFFFPITLLLVLEYFLFPL